MTKITSSLFLAALLALCLHVASAQAQLVRTCVSMAKGNDANSASFCHCTTPCRTFAVAHDNTLPDGEITVLDPGDYGGLTITKSISINNDSGGEASISVSGGTTGIIVNAPASGYVNLRGITIQGVGFGGGTGLRFNSGFSLVVTNCVIRNHTGSGIEYFPNVSSRLAVSNTLVADNGGRGILVQPAAASTTKVVLNRVEAVNNSQDGIRIAALTTGLTIKAIVADSVAASNGSNGFVASGGFAGAINLMVIRSVAANNGGVGIESDGVGATIRVGGSTITGNGLFGVIASNSFLPSYGDNNIDGNVNDGFATATIPTK